MMKQPEHILAKQLVGYRSEIAHVVEDPEDGVVYITPSQGQLDAMDELQWLASQQKARVQALLTKEQTENKVSIMTTTEINQYGMILKDVLKAEFECGRREFKGPVGGKSSTSFTVNPNPQGGIDVTVTEAIEAAQKIMKRVPLLIEAQRAK